MHLESDPCGTVRRIAGCDLGRRDGPGWVVVGQGSTENQWPGEVQGDPHVGKGVLDRLVGADRPTVLLALLHVVHGVRQQSLTAPQQLGGAGKDGEVEGVVVWFILLLDHLG